ncbi:hypothetical protein AMTRI_Chr02g260000 [Amborella trichopoda]
MAYVLSKTIAEETAFVYAEDNNSIELVSCIPVTVGGPFLTASIPASIRVLLSLITGDPELFPILEALHSSLGSISLVHIEDICNAHIFLMEQPKAAGRYICSAGSCIMSQIADFFSQEYPSFSLHKFPVEFQGAIPSRISSQKLTALGFEFKYGVEEILHQSVRCCFDRGFMMLSSAVKDDGS